MREAIAIIESVGGIVAKVHTQTFLQYFLTHVGAQVFLIFMIAFTLGVYLYSTKIYFEYYGKKPENIEAAIMSTCIGVAISVIFAVLIIFGFYKESPTKYITKLNNNQLIDCRLQGVEFQTTTDGQQIVCGMRDETETGSMNKTP